MRKYWRLLGSLTLLAVLAWRIDWGQVASAFAHLDIKLWLLAAAVHVTAQLLSAWRWQFLARVLGFGRRLGQYVAYYFIGMFFNLVLPTSVGGDVVRIWYLARGREDDPASDDRLGAFLSVFADRANGLLVLIVVACLAAACCPLPLPGWITGTVAGAGGCALAGLASLPVLPRLRPWLARSDRLVRLVDGALLYLRHPREVAAATALSVLVQGAGVVTVWLIGRALGLPVPMLYYGILVPLVALLTMLPVSLNGMGVREAGTVLLLAPLGVGSASAVTLSVLSFAAYTAVSLPGAVCYLLGRFPRFSAAAAETAEEEPGADDPAGPAVDGAEETADAVPETPHTPAWRCDSMGSLSVVIPIKDERDNLQPLYRRLRRALDPLCAGEANATLSDYELLFVDDGSIDGSFAVLEELAAADARVKVIRLRRNFGQTPALRAGIDWSRGDVLVTMDGDLQNDPADIPRLLARLGEGYDAVFGLRKDRKDNWLVRKLPSSLGNWLIRRVTGVAIKDMGCTLRALRRDLAEALPLYGEMHRFVPVLAQMHGARTVQVEVDHHPRTAGRTKYTLSRSVRVLLDLITLKFLHTYLTRPMHVLGAAGLVSMGLGGLSLLATVWMKYLLHPRVLMTGNPLLLLSVMLELVGVQFISMGLIGELLTRTYFESQGKSAYVVRATLNLDPPADRQAA